MAQWADPTSGAHAGKVQSVTMIDYNLFMVLIEHHNDFEILSHDIIW